MIEVLEERKNLAYITTYVLGQQATYGWNHPGGTSLLAECHQIMLTVELLPGSFFDENARVLLRLSNEGERTENM